MRTILARRLFRTEPIGPWITRESNNKMARPLSARARLHRRGAATVELALLLPFLCMMFVVAVDFSRVFYFSLTVTNCARNGAVYGSADPVRADDQTGIETAAKADASNLNTQQLTVTSKTDGASPPNYVDVTVQYPFATITSYPGVPGALTLSRTVRMRVVPNVPNGQ